MFGLPFEIQRQILSYNINSFEDYKTRCLINKTSKILLSDFIDQDLYKLIQQYKTNPPYVYNSTLLITTLEELVTMKNLYTFKKDIIQLISIYVCLGNCDNINTLFISDNNNIT